MVHLTLVLSTLCGLGPAPGGDAQHVDRTIEITRRDGRLVFLEKGKPSPKAVTVVVGQVVRWENKDTHPHRLVCDRIVEARPLFDTDVIEPGQGKAIVIDFEIYRKAGGKPANVITLKYHSAGHEDETGELQVLSAARRFRGAPAPPP
jgi:hypothetical protein